MRKPVRRKDRGGWAGDVSLAVTVSVVGLAASISFAGGNVRATSTARFNYNSGNLTANVDSMGQDIAAMGDLDGDGVGDALVGAGSEVLLFFLRADGTVKPSATVVYPRGAMGYGFGSAVENLGDLDGDGIADIAIGAPYERTSGVDNSGAVIVVFLNADGSEKGRRVIHHDAGGLSFPAGPQDGFGRSLARLDDMDGDGLPELAVGIPGRNAASTQTGGFAVLFLAADGTVKDASLVDAPQGNRFGHSATPIGDFDADGVPDVAVGSESGTGAIALAFLNVDGTLKAWRSIDGTTQDFSGYLDPYDRFGSELEALGDIDGDDVLDLAVGAQGDGSVWTLLMNADGTVKAPIRFTAADEGIVGAGAEDFPSALGLVGDLDGDGASEFLVGASGGSTVWVFFRDAAGENLSRRELSRSSGGVAATLSPGDELGAALARFVDLDDDGRDEMLVGAPATSTPDATGAVWLLYMRDAQSVAGRRRLTGAAGHGFDDGLDAGDRLGASLASLGDLDGDGNPDFAAGAPGDDDGGPDRGAVWIASVDVGGNVLARRKISATAGAFAGPLADGAGFGTSLASLGDIDGDGNADLAVVDDGVWILRLDATFGVKAQQRLAIPATSVAAVGDLDGDGRSELAVGQPGATAAGSVDVLFLDSDGSVSRSQRIDQTNGGLVAALPPGSSFGHSVAGLGDLDGDAVPDLGVGLRTVDATDEGSMLMVFLREDGTVATAREIGDAEGGFGFPLLEGSSLGASAVRASDLDGDGIEDLVLGNPFDLERYSWWGPSGEFFVATLGPICDPVPRQFCLGGAAGRLSMKKVPGRPPKSSLRWTLAKGDATPFEAFGTPNGYGDATEYALCVYDRHAGTHQVATGFLIQSEYEPYYAFESKWYSSSTGYRYDDRYNGRRDGLRLVHLRSGGVGEAMLQWRAMGGSIPLPASVSSAAWLHADPSVVVQVVNSTGACWTSELGVRVPATNTATVFKAVR